MSNPVVVVGAATEEEIAAVLLALYVRRSHGWKRTQRDQPKQRMPAGLAASGPRAWDAKRKWAAW